MSTIDFSAAFVILNNLEGGYWLDPNAGPTQNGVTQATYDRWRRAHSLPVRPVAASDDLERRDLLNTEFWKFWRCELLPPPWALFVFCQTVNIWARAIEIAQQALAWEGAYRGKIDGSLGPLTIAGMNAKPGAVRTAALLTLGHYATQSPMEDQDGLRNRIKKLLAAIDASEAELSRRASNAI